MAKKTRAISHLSNDGLTRAHALASEFRMRDGSMVNRPVLDVMGYVDLDSPTLSFSIEKDADDQDTDRRFMICGEENILAVIAQASRALALYRAEKAKAEAATA